MQVDIIDLGMGNVRSVSNLLKRLNTHGRRVCHPSELKSATVIIPGVGCAGSYFEKLHQAGFDTAIRELADEGKKIIGICLGFQILTHSSEESGGIEGLGLLNARTCRLSNSVTHNGWEAFHFDRRVVSSHQTCRSPRLTRKYRVSGRVYYNHEYGVVSEDNDAYNMPISHALNDYTSMMVKQNVVGIQFHPEKSQSTGLELVKQVL